MIRLNTVAPGWVDTGMNAEVFADMEFLDQVVAGIPLNRSPPAGDIAGPLLFLASDLARHITCEILNVNSWAVLSG